MELRVTHQVELTDIPVTVTSCDTGCDKVACSLMKIDPTSSAGSEHPYVQRLGSV